MSLTPAFRHSGDPFLDEFTPLDILNRPASDPILLDAPDLVRELRTTGREGDDDLHRFEKVAL